jgi:hypothetical protein
MRQRLGLVWVDAHMDSHTLESSLSHNIHGLPLACLLGHGDPRLTGIAPAGAKLLPADVCLIGVRSFEAAEAALLSQLGVRVYFMDEAAAACPRCSPKPCAGSRRILPAMASASTSMRLIQPKAPGSARRSAAAWHAPNWP